MGMPAEAGSGDKQVAEATTASQVFTVHCRGVDLKLTAKPKALLKPFKQTILEPFLKAYNPKAAKGEQMTFDDIEKVMVGPGFPYRSDLVPEWSVVTKTPPTHIGSHHSGGGN